LYGVVSQDNKEFLGLKNSKDFNVDLNIDQIIEKYIEKTMSPEQKNAYEKSTAQGKAPAFSLELNTPTPTNNDILDSLSQLNDTQLLILRYINQAFLNFFFKHSALQEKVVRMAGIEDIFSVILDDRNTNLAQQIEKTQFKNIFVIYGKLHFEGVFKDLQASDPNWKILQTKSYFPLSEFQSS